MLKKLKAKLQEDLYKNSIYLMMSTIVLSGFGFFFWTIAARLFNSYEVGIATTIISAFSIVVSLSSFGLGNALIRFLPNSNVKNHKINSAFSVSIVVAIAVSAIFLYFINYFSPKLFFIKENIYFSMIFIFGVVFFTLFNLTDSIFIAYHTTKYVLFKDTIYSIIKIISILVFVNLFAYGIFVSWITGAAISFLVCSIILVKKFSYKPNLVIYDSIIKRIFSFSVGNHLASLIKTMPAFIIPLLITNNLDPSNTAFYYIAFNIAGLLFVIPNAVASSLFAKASENEENLNRILKKAVKFISILLIPSIILFLLFDKYLLLLFGSEYVKNGIVILNLLILSSIFIAISSLYATYLNVKKKIRKLVLINTILSLSTIILVYFLLPYGLYGIGLGYLIGQGLIILFVWSK